MKKKVLFSIALAGLMLGSCSKDVIDNGGSNKPSWNENGEGYISLSLNLPTVSGGSRAEGDPSFADGEAKEYAVNDAILVLFVGASETAATFNSAYKMDLGNWEDKNDQITTSARIVQKIKEIENTGGTTKNKIYALVVLNNNGIFSVDGTQLKIITESGATAFGDGLQNLNNLIATIQNTDDVWNETGKGFLMSNSPLFNAGGGTNNPSSTSSDSGTHQSSVLAIIDESKICSTAEKAFANPAASIYVERAQAKIQVKTELSNGEGTFTINDKDGQEVTYKYTFDKWDIDNYNKQSYLTRQFNDTWAGYENASSPAFYRFVDKSSVENNVELYRTYWGTDVNYAAISSANTGNPALQAVAKTGEIPTLSKPMGEYTYCFENTTSVVPATGLDLTRVIISAKLAKDDVTDEDVTAADFFIVNGDRSEMYLDIADGSEGSIQKRIKSYILNDPGVQEAAKKAGKIIGENNLTFKFSDSWSNHASGILNNKEDFTVTTNEDDDDTNPIQNAIDAALYSVETGNVINKITIDYYKGGVCYYQAFIRHFTESECPWTKGVDQSAESTKYLGRYGVLRNNWYVLNVKSISGIGDSTYPELPEEPIDKEEFYISVDINILAWAKREQDVDL